MLLPPLIRANPLMALALLICLATLLWCILLTRRQRNGLDKTLTCLLGLFAIYESVHILKDSGLAIFAPLRTIEEWVDLLSACLYLVAASIMRITSVDRAAIKVHLRLMEANERPVDFGGGVTVPTPDLDHPLVDSCPLAVLTLDADGMVTYWNDAAEALIGWKRHEILGQELPFDVHGPIQGRNGRFLEAAVWNSPIRSPNGPPRGTLVVVAGIDALHDAGFDWVGSANPRLTMR